MRSCSIRVARLTTACAVFVLAACQAPGADLRANVYTSDQVNSRQEAKVVNILAVLPAQVAADNSANQRTGQLVGGILGALAGGVLAGSTGHYRGTERAALGAVGGGALGLGAGSLIPSTVLVSGVSIAFEEDGHTYNSAQVGTPCEFAPGRALMVQTSPTATRIQPNQQCLTTAKN